MTYSVSEMLPFEEKEVKSLLASYNLDLESTAEYTAVLKWQDAIVGTCSFEGAVLKGFAIKGCYQGGNGTNMLLSHMIQELFDRGIFQAFAYTRPQNVIHFEHLAFSLVHQTEDVALLSFGGKTTAEFVEETKVKIQWNDKSQYAAIVMNGNPFTKGHRYLIEEAAKLENNLIVFVVEENSSTFPFEVRFKLIKEGTEDLDNVMVVPGGPFMVSQGTFPSYFIRDKSSRAKVGARLDTEIFSELIATPLNIKRRYVGTEPLCQTTNAYNEIMKETLPEYGIQLKVIERKVFDDTPISASQVRSVMVNGDLEEISKLVPESTLIYLKENNDEIAKRMSSYH